MAGNNVLDAMTRGEAYFKHYGTKGMKWGVRRAETNAGPVAVEVRANPGKRVKATGGKGHGASEDAIRVAKLRQVAKKSTTDSLSNKELQDLISRMNLEQQYSRLKGEGPVGRGLKVVKNLIGIGRTGREAYSVGQTLVSDLKNIKLT